MTDLPGKAIHDHFFSTQRKRLYVQDTFGPRVLMPVSYYFRNFRQMPELEQQALELCEGRTLDIGAAAGSHAMELQRMETDVTALEISPLACEVMEARGVQQVICGDIFQYAEGQYDTLLLLMNGIGLCSTLDGFRAFLKHAASLLNSGGQLIFDSCDTVYMYEETEMPADHYYGEMTVRYEYGELATGWFTWLYMDPDTMQEIATAEGWTSDIVFRDDQHQYLAVLTLD